MAPPGISSLPKQKPLTGRELEVLDALAVYKRDQWLRPMDIGGKDASHHSETMRRLSVVKLVTRKRRAGWIRPSYLYQITTLGRRTLKVAYAPKRRAR